ncbi:MAG: IS200/IS605 family transposase [Muribaculaceae bacterium]|nr:IS200/IS605 family transposase [Muribaculaceae bacterium]
MSYTNLIYHIVFRTYRSMKSIDETHEKELYAYILGFVNNQGGKLYRVGGMPDHIHLLVGIPPMIAVSEFVRKLKFATSKWMKNSPSFPLFTGWGQSFAAFTFKKEDIPVVKHYIANQKEHHKQTTFAEEYKQFILDNGGSIDDFFLRD